MKTKKEVRKWSVETDPGDGDTVIVEDDVLVVCRRPNPENARLIAAAPTMLEMLKEALYVLKEVRPDILSSENDPTEQKIEELIGKIEVK